MELIEFPKDIGPYLIPEVGGRLEYRCLDCRKTHPIDSLLYTCPDCGGVLLIRDLEEEKKSQRPGKLWRRLFDYRRMSTIPALKGVFLFHQFIAPVIPLKHILYLGEGHTPLVEANQELKERIGVTFFFKNEGQNPVLPLRIAGWPAP